MRRHLWWLVAVVLVALNLRTPIASVPPVAGPVGRDLHLTAAQTGLLTTLPVVCMGLFAPVGALASRRWGRGRVLGAAVALILAGTALRLLPAALWPATVLAGIGIAVAGALLPSLVRARFPRWVGPVTGLYTAGLLLGLFSATQLVSALALPVLAHRRGGLSLLIALTVATSVVMLVLIAVVPSGAPYLWTALLGLGVGGQFALALTVLGSLGGGPAGSAAVSGMAFFVGYLLAAAGPVAAGWLRDRTGGYEVTFLGLAAVGTATLVAGVATGRAASSA